MNKNRLSFDVAIIGAGAVRRLNAHTCLNLSGEWVLKVDFAGEPVKLVMGV